jgi:hypothetical protein
VGAEVLDYKEITNAYDSVLDADGVWKRRGLTAETTITTLTEDGGAFVDRKKVAYTGYDEDGNATGQEVRSYASAAIDAAAISYQVIADSVYDDWGNVTSQNITSYASDAEGAEVLDYKDVVNLYYSALDPDGVWKRRGFTAETTITTLTEEGGVFVDKKKVTYTGYDEDGNATGQEVRSYATTAVDAAVISYQVIADSVYDDWSNVISQNITSYASDAVGAEVLDYKEITNV